MNKFIILLIVTFFTGCTYTNNNLETSFFKSSGNKIRTNTFDTCASFSYIEHDNNKKYGKIFKEYIRLDASCKWVGLDRSYFENLFSSTLKLKSMKVMERLDFKNYEVTTYKINDKSYMNLILKYTTNETLLIVDYNGILSSEIIKSFNTEYKNKYINEERFDSNYHNSLVNKNIINSYFFAEYEIVD
jgi:hypothetical protein